MTACFVLASWTDFYYLNCINRVIDKSAGFVCIVLNRWSDFEIDAVYLHDIYLIFIPVFFLHHGS